MQKNTKEQIPNGIFRVLNEAELLEFRQWARNYVAIYGMPAARNHLWNPIIWEEFEKIAAERKHEKLTDLAKHAHNGAGNVVALIRGLALAINDFSQPEVRDSVEVKIIVGQISFLLGESLGPSHQAIEAYEKKIGDIKI